MDMNLQTGSQNKLVLSYELIISVILLQWQKTE
jgi:hypothetical protein